MHLQKPPSKILKYTWNFVWINNAIYPIWYCSFCICQLVASYVSKTSKYASNTHFKTWFSYLMQWLFPVYFQCVDFADKKLYQMILNILQTTLSPQTVCKGLCIAWCVLTLILVVANWANTKWCKKSDMGTHLRVLSESYLKNTNMTGFRWFSKRALHSYALDESSLNIGTWKG